MNFYQYDFRVPGMRGGIVNVFAESKVKAIEVIGIGLELQGVPRDQIELCLVLEIAEEDIPMFIAGCLKDEKDALLQAMKSTAKRNLDEEQILESYKWN